MRRGLLLLALACCGCEARVKMEGKPVPITTPPVTLSAAPSPSMQWLGPPIPIVHCYDIDEHESIKDARAVVELEGGRTVVLAAYKSCKFSPSALRPALVQGKEYMCLTEDARSGECHALVSDSGAR